MPIRVVDTFEVVDVNRDERARTRFGAQRSFDAIDRGRAIIEPRERRAPPSDGIGFRAELPHLCRASAPHDA